MELNEIYDSAVIVDDSDVMFSFLCLFVHSREFSANYIRDERQRERIYNVFFMGDREKNRWREVERDVKI